MSTSFYVILVDGENNVIGLEDKVRAHIQKRRHSAFSVFLFNDMGHMLLQCRADGKYHSAGLWSNTCCSHPGIDDECERQAHERLKYEMGVDCSLKGIGVFAYEAELDNGMYENEIDSVFIGIYNGIPAPNPREVKDFKYVPYAEIKEDMKREPEKYTVWFRMMIDEVYKEYRNLFDRK